MDVLSWSSRPGWSIPSKMKRAASRNIRKEVTTSSARWIWFASLVGVGCCSSIAAGDAPGLVRADVYVGGIDGYHTYRIPALVVTAEGTVLAFCEGRKNSPRDNGDIDLLLKRSRDNGATWSEQIVVYEEGGDAEITIGNPCPIVDRHGVIHLLFTRNNKRLFYTRSTDDGRAWAEPREHTEILDGFDYPLVRVATGPVHGIQLRSGRLVVPVWVCDCEVKDRAKNPTFRQYQSGVIYSDDEGRTWETGKLVPPTINSLNECTVLERADGSLLLNMRAYRAGARAISESTDGGVTWSSPVLDSQLPCPTCQASIIRLSAEAVVFSNPASKTRDKLTIRLSADQGRTWSQSRVLEPGPAGYSDLAITQDGDVLCIYECGEKVYNEKIAIARLSRAWILDRSGSKTP